MTSMFKEIIDLSEQLLVKINKLNQKIDRRKLDAEDYAITSYRDDLTHTLESVELSEEKMMELMYEIKRVSKVRREVKEMIFFLNNKKHPLKNVIYELEKLLSYLNKDNATYYVKTEEGVDFFNKFLGSECQSDIKFSLDSKNLKRSRILSKDFENTWAFIEGITENEGHVDYSEQDTEGNLLNPVLEEEVVAPQQEYRNYVLQNTMYGTWQLYSRIDKKVVREERELNNMIEYIRSKEYKINYHHYMSDPEVDELLEAFENKKKETPLV